ncbi:MAG: hypothetical protein ACLFTR_02145 [Candidatus Woesearchaeota archaeon]
MSKGHAAFLSMMFLILLFVGLSTHTASAYGVCNDACPIMWLQVREIEGYDKNVDGELELNTGSTIDTDIQAKSIDDDDFCPGYHDNPGGHWPFKFELGGVESGKPQSFCDEISGPMQYRVKLEYVDTYEGESKNDAHECESKGSKTKETDWAHLGGYCQDGKYYADGDSGEGGCEAAVNYLLADDSFREDSGQIESENLPHWMGKCCGDDFDDSGKVFVDQSGAYATYVCTASDGKFGWADSRAAPGVYTVANDAEFWDKGHDSSGDYFDFDNDNDWHEAREDVAATHFNSTDGVLLDKDPIDESELDYEYVVATSGEGSVLACDPDDDFDNMNTDLVHTMTFNETTRFGNEGFLCGTGYKLSSKGDGEYEAVRLEDKDDIVMALCAGEGSDLEDNSGDESNSFSMEPGDIFVHKEDGDEESVWYCTEKAGFVPHSHIKDFSRSDALEDEECNPNAECCDDDAEYLSDEEELESFCHSDCVRRVLTCDGDSEQATWEFQGPDEAGKICVDGKFVDPDETNNMGVRYSYGHKDCEADGYYLGCQEEIEVKETEPDSRTGGEAEGYRDNSCDNSDITYAVPSGRILDGDEDCGELSVKFADKNDNHGIRYSSAEGFRKATEHYLGCDGNGDQGNRCIFHAPKTGHAATAGGGREYADTYCVDSTKKLNTKLQQTKYKIQSMHPTLGGRDNLDNNLLKLIYLGFYFDSEHVTDTSGNGNYNFNKQNLDNKDDNIDVIDNDPGWFFAVE